MLQCSFWRWTKQEFVVFYFYISSDYADNSFKFPLLGLSQLSLCNLLYTLVNNFFVESWNQEVLYPAVETSEEDDELQRALAASMESMNPDKVVSEDKDAVTVTKEEETCPTKKPVYPPLPEEPTGDRSLECRVGFRLPDGRRVQRKFLRSDPIQVRFITKYKNTNTHQRLNT